MDIGSVPVATATLLCQLILRLEKEGVLGPNAVDLIFQESIELQVRDTRSETNDAAATYLSGMWFTVREHRDKTAP